MVGRTVAFIRRLVDGKRETGKRRNDQAGPWDREEWDVALANGSER